MRRPALALLATSMVLLPMSGHGSEPREVMARVKDALAHWRPAAAMRGLEELRAQGVPDSVLAPALARVKFYEGAYDEALALVQGSGDQDLEERIKAAAEATRGMKEIPTSDGHWKIRVLPGPDEILVPHLMELLPRVRRVHGEAFQVFPETPIVLEVYDSTRTLAKATGLTADQIENSGTIAICKFDRIMITSPRGTVRGYPWMTTVSHEYVHLVINHRATQRVPIWFHEGLARYNESRWQEGEPHQVNGPDTMALLLGAAARGQLITLDEMSPSMALLPTQRHTELAFAEVLSLTTMLYDEVGQTGINRALDLIDEGRAPNARRAIEQVLGTPFQRFEAKWRASLRRRARSRENIPYVNRIRFRKDQRDPFLVDLDEVERKARDFGYLGQLLRGQGRPEAALVEFRKAAAVSERRSPVIQNWIAETYLAMGNPREALAALEGIRERHRYYEPTLVNEGLALLGLGRSEEAAERFEAALRINPFDPRIHVNLAKLYRELDDPRAAREEEAVRLLGATAEP